MNQYSVVVMRRAHRRQRGQVLPFAMVSITVLFGMGALALDYGLASVSQSELNASTQAATFAGAEAMAQPGATVNSVTSAITTYSGAAGSKNAQANLTSVSMAAGYPKLSCLTTLTSAFGIQCTGPSGTNAIIVRQQVTVPLTFAQLLGTKSITLTATATASMRGASAGPFNVAIIVDATHSMTSDDSASNCGNTRIYCALAGVQVLLQNLSPCLASETSCGAVTNGNVANSVDRVSLLTFPAVTTATAVDDYNCGKTAPSTTGYTTPFPATSTYQIVNFSSDYRTSDRIASLNASSSLVASSSTNGKAGQPNCLYVKGGFGTYYAQVIAAAQAYLVAEQSSFPNSQNVLILLSDGDATATCTSSAGGLCTAGDMVGASTTAATGAYPPESTLQQCHQAVAAAQAAAKAGTRVYSVAYGAEAAGCTSDSSPAITPCQTMQQIASSPGYFFSDYTATGGSSSCISASQPATSLNQIFQAIAGDLTVAKLIPNGTQ